MFDVTDIRDLPERSLRDRIIDKTLDLLGPNGERWLQGNSFDGERMCLGHAIMMAVHHLDRCEMPNRHPLVMELNGRLFEYGGIVKFNDRTGRQFVEIEHALEDLRVVRADEKLREPVEIFPWDDKPKLKKMKLYSTQATNLFTAMPVPTPVLNFTTAVKEVELA